MSSSYCLGSGRAYGFELEIAKPSSTSPSPARSSSASSTVSESSNAPRAVSFKKARAPRKRPNQTYNEAAALLASVYPTVFSAAKLAKHSPFAAFPEPDELLPPLPVMSDAAFLIHKPRPENPIADGDACLERKHRAPLADWECASPASNVSWEPTPMDPFDDDFDAESILDEESGGGIDSIIGDSAEKSSAVGEPSRSDSCMNPLLRSLIGHRLGAKFHLGLGFMKNFRRALRNSDEGEWWRSPAVLVCDINPDFKPPAALPPAMTSDKKKKKKKKKMDKADEAAATAITANSASTPSPAKLKASLGLKLSHEDVLRSWSSRGSIFSDGPDSPNSASDALARLEDIDLFLDTGVAGGVREASVLRYKEKRRNRLFEKKIRYEVRKTNADRRPRIKGRFVRRPFEAIEEESQ
ncbi:protein CHLOROPLAST IMPORT APPARATUS 2-like isoform X2 [Curcuma longa]|uniref:protein CHLOROPLAST IMPORT APPARATUS 2-like isoform X2 n=1 Tax=Curcuma longa TaxID=136217 RepID=UPI003D9EB7B1